MLKRRPIILALLFACGACLGMIGTEYFLRGCWPQEDIYLYEYRDGLVFNRAHFKNPFAMTPLASVQTLRKSLPSWVQKRGGPLAAQFFKRNIETNAAGQRDDRLPSKQQKAPFRILNLGDSIGFGWPVSLRETYLKRLEREFRDLETVNCSLIAAHTAELVKLYEANCSQYEADLVLVQMVIHVGTIAPDYIDTDPYGPDYRLIKALWRSLKNRAFEWVTWEQDGTPRLRVEALAEPGVQKALHDYFSPKLPFYHRLHLVRFIENRWMAGSLNESGGNFLDDQLLRGKRLKAPSEKIRATLTALNRLRTSIEGRGAKMLVLFFPTSYQARQAVVGKRPEFELLKRTLRERGFEYVDAGERITAKNLDDIYYLNDHHPKAAGHALIADMLSEKIRRHYDP